MLAAFQKHVDVLKLLLTDCDDDLKYARNKVKPCSFNFIMYQEI